MPKAHPFLEEVVHVIADFLETLEYTKEAAKIRKQYQIPEWIAQNNPLLKKGLKKVLKQYINSDPKVLKYYQNRKMPVSSESEGEQESNQQQIVQVKKNGKIKAQKGQPSPKKSPLVVAKQVQPKQSNWVTSRFDQPKRLEDINDITENGEKIIQEQPRINEKKKKSKKSKVVIQSSSESSQEQVSSKAAKKAKKIKKSKKQQKIKGPVDTSYLNSEDDFELEAKQKLVKKSKKSSKEKVIEQQEDQPIMKSPVITTRKVSAEIKEQLKTQQQIRNNYSNNYSNNKVGRNGYKKSFSRINPDEVGPIPENLRDNTYQAKSRYGAAAGDEWGRFGHEKLKDARGDSFKKTKGKLKNKAFQGSGINMDQINSIPL